MGEDKKSVDSIGLMREGRTDAGMNKEKEYVGKKKDEGR